MAWFKGKCDKCGEEVELGNDATVLQAKFQKNPLIIVANQPRHLLPTDKCEGSPSRAQYLEGQPRDTRGYAYNSDLEKTIRDAYEEMQRGDLE